MAADGFDENDLRLLARRAAAAKQAVRGYNGLSLPFNEPRLLTYLELLEASPEPRDGEIVLSAARMARLAVRAAYQENLGDEKEPEAELIDRELSALVGDLQEILRPFDEEISTPKPEGPIVDAAEHQADLEEIRQHQHWLRTLSQKVVQEFNSSPIRTAASGAALAGTMVTAYLVEPWLVERFAALFILALLQDKRVLWGQVKPLLDRQAQEITAFEHALERNKQAVETVTGLYQTAKNAIVEVRSRSRLVQRFVARIFGTAEPPPKNPAFPEPRSGIGDLPPNERLTEATPPAPDLPPPDCTTDNGRPGYLLAGTCYPLDTTALDLRGKEDIDFAKLAAFRQLTHLYLDNTAIADLTPVVGLASLQDLSLNRTPVSDLTPIASLSSLRTLSLNRTPVSDLVPLAGLTNLRVLSLNRTLVSDLTPVASLTDLQVLSLNSTPMSDLAPVASVTSLQTLSLDKTQVSDLSPIVGLTSLQVLALNRTPLRDLTPIASLSRLQEIWLNGTQVSDLTPLTNVTSLQELSLNGTGVNDLTPLKQLTNLRTIRLSDGSELGGGSSDDNRHEVQKFLATL